MRHALALAALALCLFAAPTAEAARTEFFGIAQGPPLDPQDRQGMQAARIQTARFGLSWRLVEPTQGPYRWASIDALVGGLAQRGIRPVSIAWGTPSWVGTGNIARPPLDSSADKQAWRDFLAAWAMSIAVQGSVGFAPRFRNSYPCGSRHRAAAAVQASVHSRYCRRGSESSYDRYSTPRL